MVTVWILVAYLANGETLAFMPGTALGDSAGARAYMTAQECMQEARSALRQARDSKSDTLYTCEPREVKAAE
jgi:hypothetical protein